MPIRPLTDTDISSTNRGRKYPNPFFDLANDFIPKNIKTLFKYCRTFFYTNGFLHNVITKLTEYPITELLFMGDLDSETKRKYLELLHRYIKIKSFLIEIGLDYFTYGNSFISFNLKFKRFLVCPLCKTEHQIEHVKYKLKRYEFVGECPNPDCGAQGQIMKINDVYIKSVKNFNLIKWAPENIDIEYNPLSGTSNYYYSMPAKIKNLINAGHKKTLQEVPEIFLQALKQKKKIELDPDNLYHFKRPTLAEDDMGWGKPLILPALKEIYYLQTLRRGNEAIAQEHIVPKKSIFPANTTTLDPYTQMNLGKWKNQIEEQIKKWRDDPNHIGVFPIPIGYQELGGNARTLLLTPEMKFLEETIINSLGVPVEFIKGGTTWTGSSISLRIVENHFLVYRELLIDFINHFLIEKLSIHLDYPAIQMRFKELRMTDDSESKQLAININATNKISDYTLLDRLGYDPSEESKLLKRSFDTMLQNEIQSQESMAEAQGRAQVIMGRYQTRAQKAAEDEIFNLRVELFQEELAVEMGGVPGDPNEIIEKYAIQILSMPEPVAKRELDKLAKRMPVMHSLVLERIQFLLSMEQQAMEEVPEGPQQAAPNEKKSGTREGDKIKPKGERHKGVTKGSPK